jgi:hypothetical protein
LGIAENILHRVTQGTAPWWDVSNMSPTQMFEQLALLPSALLSPVLKRISRPAFYANWLPALPDAVFDKLLSVLWKRDVGMAIAYGQVAKAVVDSQKSVYQINTFRAFVLEQSLDQPDMDARRVLQILLLGSAKASGQSAAAWNALLKAELEKRKGSGNLFLEAFREILTTQGDMPVETRPGVEKPAHKEAENKAENITIVPEYRALLESDFALIWQFFQTGAFPAGASISNPETLEQTVFRLLDKHPELAIPFFSELFARPETTKRLFQYFNPNLYAALAAKLLAPHFETYITIRDQLFRQIETEHKALLQQHFYRYLFSLIARKSPFPGSLTVFTEGLVETIAAALKMPEDQLWTHLRWMLEKPNNPMGILEQILPPILVQKQSIQKQADEPIEEIFPPEAALEDEILLVPNAGLILVAPFLPRLFKSLNLLENQVFVDEAAACKAVHLLQYLATGQMETPEHLLVFNKILCGLPLETPVPLGAELSEAETDMCMSLLNAVIGNWEIMKNTSVTNLRGAFLLREGSLKEETERWFLHIEKKAYDIVLEYIPWTISMVKLPWMDKRIDIEWKKKSSD